MTKQEWKTKLVELLLNEPGTKRSNRYINESLLNDYLDRLETISDPYYGITHEIVVCIEKSLGM